MSLTDKERTQYTEVTEAYRNGRIGNDSFRSGSVVSVAKLTKADVLSVGTRLLAEKSESMRESRIAETLRTKPDNFYVITDDNDLPRMIQRLREEVSRQQTDAWFRKIFGLFDNTLIRRKLLERGISIPPVMSLTVWDTETSGLDKMLDLSGGYSVWLPILNEGYYVAYGHLTGERQCTRSNALGAIERFMTLPEHIKSFHNANYDLSIMLNDGLKPQGIRYDSQDVQRLLNEHEESVGLKPLIAKYKTLIGIDVDDFTFEDLFKGSPMVYGIEVVGIYAIKDVLKGWALTRWQIDNMVSTDNLHVPFFEIRQYLTEINVNIERTGFVIDLDALARLGVEFRSKLVESQANVIKAYGVDEADFLRRMDRVVSATKIEHWCESQRKKAERLRTQIAGKHAKIAELAAAGKTHLKSYSSETEALKRYETDLAALPEPIADNAPAYVEAFEFTNDNHLRYLIYDYLGVKDRTKEIAKDKSRTRAVSKDVLERYYEAEESLQPLAAVSMYEKLLGTYVDKIPLALDVDGRLHTELDTVSTGRYSSKGYKGKPNDTRPAVITDENYLAAMRALIDAPEKSVSKGTNVQNIPSRTKEGKRVRMTFTPPPGRIFLGSDLSSIEPRLQAHIMAVEFDDDIFAEMFRMGLDPYIEFAAILFDVPKEHCTDDYAKEHPEFPPYRKLMKQLFLAEGYGQAFGQFYKAVQPFGISEAQALNAYRKFDEILPGFKRMVETAFEHLREHGWTATLWHQKRRFPAYRENWRRLSVLMRKARINGKDDAELSKKSRRLSRDECSEFWQLIRETGRDERACFNHRIQGSGANVLQMCMIMSYYILVLERGWEFTLTLHDEQKHAAPADELTEEAVKLYSEIMTDTVTLACPLKCDSVIEDRWMSEFSVDEWDFVARRPKPEFADKYAKYAI
ncbi:DNA polymerase [Paenibacillus agricola]|nr:DNA polymerase [Paenibacillus agricola]